jgi:hypothetical protein
MIYEVLGSRLGCFGGVWERLFRLGAFFCMFGLGRRFGTGARVLFGFAVESGMGHL